MFRKPPDVLHNVVDVDEEFAASIIKQHRGVIKVVGQRGHRRPKIVDKVPVGRLATPEEIARAILFLADDESAFITGETLSVNGGLYMQ